MKKILSFLLFASFFCLLSCELISLNDNAIEGSVDTISKSKDIGAAQPSSFCIDSVSKVTVIHGDEYSIHYIINENLEKYVDIRDRNNTLYIQLESGKNYKNLIFDVYITSPDLTSIDIDGVSTCLFESFELNHDLFINIDGVSSVSAKNSSANGTLSLKIDGTSVAHIEELHILQNALVYLDGVSKAWIDVEGIVSGSVSGVSNLYYRSGQLGDDFSCEEITCSVKTF